MALSILTGSSSITCIKYFDIRVDQDHLILRGAPAEATGALLRGTLVLCTTDAIKTHGITLRFRGTERVLFWYQAVSGSTVAKSESEFLTHTWHFGNNRGPASEQQPPSSRHGSSSSLSSLAGGGASASQTLPAGNYAWPFELPIAGDAAESIEGSNASWVIYQLKATLARSVLHKDLVARKHVRILRTFDPSASELSQSVAIANRWPDKVRYDIATPTKGVLFGTAVPLRFVLQPLRKGLRVARVEAELRESWTLQVRGPAQPPRDFRTDKEIARDVLLVPDDEPLAEVDGAEAYQFDRTLQLPRTLQHCRPSVDGAHIQIAHAVRFVVALRNPDGHASEVRGCIPVHVFLAPEAALGPGPAHALLEPAPTRPLADTYTEGGLVAPPGYGAHTLDQLFEGVDPAAYVVTPGARSAAATPSEALSRSGSTDDVAALEPELIRRLSATSLQTRLAGLHDSSAAARRAPGQLPQQRGESSGGGAGAGAGVGGHALEMSPARRGHASASSLAETLRRAAGPLPVAAVASRNHQRSASYQPHAPGATSASQQSSPVSPSAEGSLAGLSMAAPPRLPQPRGSDGSLPAAATTGAAVADVTHRPSHIDLSPATLSKVPSYQTALHTPALVGNGDDLPTYEAAVSRPASPSPPPPPRVSPPAAAAAGGTGSPARWSPAAAPWGGGTTRPASGPREGSGSSTGTARTSPPARGGREGSGGRGRRVHYADEALV